MDTLENHSSDDGYRPVGLLEFAHVQLMGLESFGTQIQFETAQHKWHRDIAHIREESRRKSEMRRAREDAARAQELQQRIPPVPGLVTTFQNSYAGILEVRNHL